MLWNVYNGIPFDVAFGLDDVTRAAFAIVFSEFNGGEFDWEQMQFKKD